MIRVLIVDDSAFVRQALVRKKNRKLRLLRQLYPEVRIKLLYMRDFRALMVKYGRVDFLVEMNGTNGHHGGSVTVP